MNKKLFAAMMRRRVSCPQVTQQLWDAIATIRAQRQVPNMDRISRYMARVHQINEDEVRRQLNHCVRDNLIRMIKRIGCKGSKIGIEQEGYALPKEEMKDDGHDWYCFSCHRGGDVICCTSCHRVYHLACLARGELPDEDVKNTFVCSVCKDMGVEREDKNRMKRSQLNHLLSFTCSRLRERLPANLCDRTVAPPPRNPYAIPERTSAVVHHHPAGSLPVPRADVQGQSERWRAAFLIYRPADLKTMEQKASEGKYRLLEEFRADAMTIVHNVVIYHGVHSSLADMARQMLRDCVYDLTEIRQCRDCYRVSNEKKDKHWFCEPCRPPHQLVYAKQKGFPYWPAKVIKVEGDQYDVRFFGGQHQRAHIEKVHIRPISVNIHTLQVKRTSSWNKACEELRRHQELLKKLESKGRLASSSEDEDDEESSSDEDDDSETKSPPPKKRGPGRPPKNPAAAEAKKLQQSPRKVGRPRKVEKREEEVKEESSDDDEDDDESEEERGGGGGRGRRRGGAPPAAVRPRGRHSQEDRHRARRRREGREARVGARTRPRRSFGGRGAGAARAAVRHAPRRGQAAAGRGRRARPRSVRGGRQLHLVQQQGQGGGQGAGGGGDGVLVLPGAAEHQDAGRADAAAPGARHAAARAQGAGEDARRRPGQGARGAGGGASARAAAAGGEARGGAARTRGAPQAAGVRGEAQAVVLQLRERGDLPLLLEHGLLQHRLPAAALAEGAQALLPPQALGRGLGRRRAPGPVAPRRRGGPTAPLRRLLIYRDIYYNILLATGSTDVAYSQSDKFCHATGENIPAFSLLQCAGGTVEVWWNVIRNAELQ